MGFLEVPSGHIEEVRRENARVTAYSAFEEDYGGSKKGTLLSRPECFLLRWNVLGMGWMGFGKGIQPH